MRYHLGLTKYEISLKKFESVTLFEENCKCQLELIKQSVKLESLYWKLDLHSVRA